MSKNLNPERTLFWRDLLDHIENSHQNDIKEEL